MALRSVIVYTGLYSLHGLARTYVRFAFVLPSSFLLKFHRRDVLLAIAMTPPMERIQILETIEKDVILCLQSAGQAFNELSKEKCSLKQAEGHTHQFLKTLAHVESKLSEQINYLTQVSTGQPHEGSGYASQKVLQMAWHRLEHVRSRVNELDRIKNKQR